MTSRLPFLGSLVFSWWIVLAPSRSLAQEAVAEESGGAQEGSDSSALPSALPSAVLLQSARAGVDEGTAGAFDRLLRQRLDALGIVRVDANVVLDLEQLQLALGCMGETASCLAAVASELGADLVLVPSIDRGGTELVTSVLLFDARDGSQRRALRRASGEQASTQIFEAVDGQLRELFGLPAAAPAPDAADLAARVPEGAAEGGDVRDTSGISAGPIVLLGLGAAALIAGGATAAVAASSADEYRSSSPTTASEVDATLDLLSRAQAEATVANVFFVAGGVLAAGGLVWLLAAGREDGGSLFAVAPVIAPGHAGVALAGRFEGMP